MGSGREWRWGNRLTVAGSGGVAGQEDVLLYPTLPPLLWQALGEDVCGCPALHAASLAGWFGSVAHQVGVEIWLHGLNALVKRLRPLMPE